MDLEHSGPSARFAAILVDELIHSIVETGRFLVVSGLSSSRYKDALDDARAIGKALNADLLIEGRVRGIKSCRTVSAQLTDAASGYHLWSTSFQCPGASPADEAGDAARRIARMLESDHRDGNIIPAAQTRDLLD
jgi:serine/threonine-protein kinase